jgi:hypothetical protein
LCDKNVNLFDRGDELCHFFNFLPPVNIENQLYLESIALARSLHALPGCSVDGFFNLKE